MTWPRFSFPQMLLVAFLVIGALLGATALRSLFLLESLMVLSRASTEQAIELSTAAQSLGERSQAMERAARQSLVLGDRQLRQVFVRGAEQAHEILGRLRDNDLPGETVGIWQKQLERIGQQLDGPLETALDREREVAQQFRELDRLNALVAQQVQTVIGHRNEALQARFERNRQQLAVLVLSAIVLAAAMALGFGIWLTRPLRRLERAIVGLGENRLHDAIDIPGPPDIRSVGQQLEWLRLRLTELDADKARFLRHISHELKTPLASMHEGVAVLGDGVAGPLSDSQAEVVTILRHNTQQLQQQIEALLRFNAAAFEARQLHRQPTSLLSLVRAQVDEQRLRWQARQLKVSVQGTDMTLPLDGAKIASALGNLLSNAIRYSPIGGHITLELSRQPGVARLDITDEGPGVAEEDAARVFEPFFRGTRQPADAAKGTGIGLSIVQEYMHAHGGRIALLSSPRGAHFRIELPHAD